MPSPVLQVRILDPDLDAWITAEAAKRDITRSEMARLCMERVWKGTTGARPTIPLPTRAVPPANDPAGTQGPTGSRRPPVRRTARPAASRMHAVTCKCPVCHPPK